MMKLVSQIWAIEFILIVSIILFYVGKDYWESYQKRVAPIVPAEDNPAPQEIKETSPLFLLAEEFGWVRNDFYRHVLAIWEKKKRVKLLTVNNTAPFYFENYVEDTFVTRQAREKANNGEEVECFLQLVNNTFGIYIERQWTDSSTVKLNPLFTPLKKDVDVADMIKELLLHIVVEGRHVPNIKHEGIPIDKMEFIELGNQDKYRNVPLDIKKKVLIRSDFTYTDQRIKFKKGVNWIMEWMGEKWTIYEIYLLLAKIEKREWEIEAKQAKEEKEARDHQLLQFETKKEIDLL